MCMCFFVRVVLDTLNEINEDTAWSICREEFAVALFFFAIWSRASGTYRANINDVGGGAQRSPQAKPTNTPPRHSACNQKCKSNVKKSGIKKKHDGSKQPQSNEDSTK